MKTNCAVYIDGMWRRGEMRKIDLNNDIINDIYPNLAPVLKDGIGRRGGFSTLSAWEAATTGNLVEQGECRIGVCHGDTPINPERDDKMDSHNEDFEAREGAVLKGVHINTSDPKDLKRIKAAARYSRLNFWGAVVLFSGLGNFIASKAPAVINALGEFLVQVSGK